MSIVFPFDVIHDKRGEGKAIGLLKKGALTYINVEFKEEVRAFLYPHQFFTHLKAKNSVIQEEIETQFEKKNIHDMPIIDYGYCSETRAIDVYKKFASIFHWDRSKTIQFAPLKCLCADNVTPEGYGVYMLVHNDLCEAYNEIFSWYTYVKADIIEEVWFLKSFSDDFSDRIIFARTPRGYEFKGIYRLYNAEIRKIKGKDRLVKIYKRIATTYPAREFVDIKPIIKRSPIVRPPERPEIEEIESVTDKCKIKAFVLEEKKETTISIDIEKRPLQKNLIGKVVGDTFKLPNVELTYRIDKIFVET